MSAISLYADELHLLCSKSKAVKLFVLKSCLIGPKILNKYIIEHKANKITHFHNSTPSHKSRSVGPMGLFRKNPFTLSGNR